MKYKIFNLLPSFGTNTYLIWDEKTKEAAVIDPSAPSEEFIQEIRNLKPKYLILTHAHGDHIGGIEYVKDNFDINICIHKEDADALADPVKNLSYYFDWSITAPKPDILLQDNDDLFLGSEKLKIIHTPGHSKGGICILTSNFIVTGDTLFNKGIGRTDLSGGDHRTLINSIEKKIFSYDDKLEILPGHGPVSTIGKEKQNNPFVGTKID
ncbi:MAG: MBL fold metallo-hydrolase [Candidatus Cloacimonetes bacterium]|nr:MBL fold metallo-hydrolase [Candidatus Cloacimonadota bacterium]